MTGVAFTVSARKQSEVEMTEVLRLRFRACACVMILILVLSGCFSDIEANEPSGQPEPPRITLTPVDLFEGDSAKFMPFLGSMTGSFKLTYEGDKPKARMDIDIWENGRKVDSAGSVYDLFSGQDETVRDQGIEIIISIETHQSMDGKDAFNTIKVAVADKAGSGLYPVQKPWDTKLLAKGLVHDTKPRSFKADQPVHVFAMHATSTNSIHTADLSPESLGETEAALVFTLHFEE